MLMLVARGSASCRCGDCQLLLLLVVVVVVLLFGRILQTELHVSKFIPLPMTQVK